MDCFASFPFRISFPMRIYEAFFPGSVVVFSIFRLLPFPYSLFVLYRVPSLPEQIGISAGGDGSVKRNKLSCGLYRKKYLGIKGTRLIFVSRIKGRFHTPERKLLRENNNIHHMGERKTLKILHTCSLHVTYQVLLYCGKMGNT